MPSPWDRAGTDPSAAVQDLGHGDCQGRASGRGQPGQRVGTLAAPHSGASVCPVPGCRNVLAVPHQHHKEPWGAMGRFQGLCHCQWELELPRDVGLFPPGYHPRHQALSSPKSSKWAPGCTHLLLALGAGLQARQGAPDWGKCSIPAAQLSTN